MISYSELTSRASVGQAIDEFHRIGRSTFLERYGFGPARDYFVQTERGLCDSKAIFAAAYEIEHGFALGPNDFSGGRTAAAQGLVELGFDVTGISVPTVAHPPAEHQPRRLIGAEAREQSPSVCEICRTELPMSGQCDFCMA